MLRTHRRQLSVISAMLCVAAILVACGGAQKPAGSRSQRGIASIKIEPKAGTKLVADRDVLREGLALELARRRGEPFERYQMVADKDRLKAWYVRHGFFNATITAAIARDDEDDAPGESPAPLDDSANQPGRRNRDATTSDEPALADDDSRSTRDRKRERQRARRDVEVVFEIDEGPRARVHRVEITGLPSDVPVGDVRDKLPLADGDVFDYEAYDLAKPALTAVLSQAGYAHVELTASVVADRVLGQAIIRLDYKPGPRSTLGNITIVGVEGRVSKAARARLDLKPGDVYSSTKLADARSSLYDMGRFATVRVEPTLKDENAVVPVLVTVTQSSRHELRLGGGLASDPATYGVRGRAGYSISSYPTALSTTRIDFEPALVVPHDFSTLQPRLELRSSVERLDLLRPRLIGVVEAALQYRTLEAFTAVGPRLRATLRSPIVRGLLTGAVGWQFELTSFRAIDPALNASLRDELEINSWQRVGFFEQTLVLELRDVPSAPTRGGYAELRVQEGGTFAGGAPSYLRVIPDVRGYLPLPWKMVLAARARLGVIVGDAPVLQRFFGGGANGQRGFPERQLSPFATGVNDNGNQYTVVYGGTAQFDAGLELRATLGTLKELPIGGAVFLDGGDVTNGLASLDVLNLHWATGVGLRVATPIGAVRLDVGYRLNRTGAGEPNAGDHLAIHLGIGEAF